MYVLKFQPLHDFKNKKSAELCSFDSIDDINSETLMKFIEKFFNKPCIVVEKTSADYTKKSDHFGSMNNFSYIYKPYTVYEVYFDDTKIYTAYLSASGLHYKTMSEFIG